MNFSLANLIVGLIGLILGAWMVKDAYHINNHIYFLDFVERKWGPGSGTTAYRYIGLGLCALSMFIMLGLVDITSGNQALLGGGDQNISPIQTNSIPSVRQINIAP